MKDFRGLKLSIRLIQMEIIYSMEKQDIIFLACFQIQMETSGVLLHY